VLQEYVDMPTNVAQKDINTTASASVVSNESYSIDIDLTVHDGTKKRRVSDVDEESSYPSVKKRRRTSAAAPSNLSDRSHQVETKIPDPEPTIAWTPPSKRITWTPTETQAFVSGLKSRGVGNWANIKGDAGEDLSNRTNVQIKDKWLTTLQAARRVAKTNDEKAVIDGVRKAWKLDSWAKIVELAGLSSTSSTDMENCRHLDRIQVLFWQNVDAGIEQTLRKGRKASRSRRV
jgi:hypothetical protein